MLDRNKLNRVKGILSARDGTLVPKFVGGGTFYNYLVNKKGMSPKSQNDDILKTMYSLEYSEWEHLNSGTTSPFLLGQENAIPWNNPTLEPHIETLKELAAKVDANNPAYLDLAKNAASSGMTSLAVLAKQAEEAKNSAKEQTFSGGGLPEIVVTPEMARALDASGKITADVKGLSFSGFLNADLSKITMDADTLASLNEASAQATKAGNDLQQQQLAELLAAATAKTNAMALGMQMAGLAADTIRSVAFKGLAEKDSLTTSTINGAYDAVSSSLMAFSPVGTMIGGAMKVGALAGDAMQAIGGGTDLMTTADKIMDSSFFSWNIGALNGFLGSKADSLAVDKETISKVGSSYGGTTADIYDAQSKANKKYGLFSSGARKKANRAIADARNRLSIMAGIADEASNRKISAASNYENNSLSYNMNLAGGYDLRYMRAAKKGTKIQYFKPEFLVELTDIEFTTKLSSGGIIDPINLNLEFEVKLTEIIQLEKGGVIEEEPLTIEKLQSLTNTFEKFKKYLKERGSEEDYDLKEFYNCKDTFVDEDGEEVTPYEEWLKTETREPGLGHMSGAFKKPWHITYEGKNGELWENTEDGWVYHIPEGHKDKNGKEYTLEDYLRYFSDPEGQRSYFIYKGQKYRGDGSKVLPEVEVTPEYKKGGTIKLPEIEVIEIDTTLKSVIPEGALHKNKHHLDSVGVDDSELTKKGIPVVDNSGEQLAEIELNEIIFTLEVTKELEKRYKEYYQEDTKNSRKEELALEAGKLLWKEILYNTDDRTGLINTLKKGGIITSSEKLVEEKADGGIVKKDLEELDIIEEVLEEFIPLLSNILKPNKDISTIVIKETVISEENKSDKKSKDSKISLDDIDKMVKQALINILTK